MQRRHMLGAIAAAIATTLPGLAAAQDLPAKKALTLVVGFAAGGAADTAAHIIGKKLADNTGFTVVIENKAGAGGNIAHQLVCLRRLVQGAQAHPGPLEHRAGQGAEIA